MLFVAQTTDPVAAALGSPAGRVIVIDEVRLARALRERGYDVVTIAPGLRSLARSGGARVCALATAPALADGCAGAIVGLGLSEVEAWRDALAALSRVVSDGGLVVLIDRGDPSELSRRALCGGLAQIEQRFAGRSCVTSGRIRRWS